MAKNQTAAAKTAAKNNITPPAAFKTPEAAKKGAKGNHLVAPGTVSGPKGKKLANVPADAPAQVTEEQRAGERRQAQSDAAMKFATTNLSTPAAHAPALTAEQAKQAAFQKEMAELAAKHGVTLPTIAAKAPKADKLEQNGITRPAAGTVTGNVWAAADSISFAQGGSPATIAQVKAHASMKEVNDHTIKTQYARWRQYNGIKGRIVLVKPAPAEGHYEGVPVLK